MRNFFIKKKNTISIISKELNYKYLDQISSEVKDRRQIFKVSGKYYLGGEKALIQKVSKVLKLKYIDTIDILQDSKLLEGLPIKELKAVGAYPIIKNGCVLGLVCVDRDFLEEKFPVPKKFPIYLSTWSSIQEAWIATEKEFSEKEKVSSTYSDAEIKLVLPKFIEKILKIAFKHKVNNFQVTLGSKPQYIITTSEGILKGEINPRLSYSLYGYLKDKSFYKCSVKIDSTDHVCSVEVLNDDLGFSVIASDKKTNKKNIKTEKKIKKKSEYTHQILLVDDSAVFLAVLKRYLNKYNYELIGINDSVRALKELKSGNILPDLVISDLHMPNMTGFEFLSNIRSHKKISKLPVVMITSDINIETKLELIGKGADAFIGKSEDPRLISVQVNSLLKRRANESLRGNGKDA